MTTKSPKIGIDETTYASNQGTTQTDGTHSSETNGYVQAGEPRPPVSYTITTSETNEESKLDTLGSPSHNTNYTPYPKEFDDEIKSAFDCIWVNAVNWGKSKLPGKDVPKVYKMASKGLIKYFSSSIESARREERKRVAEMIEEYLCHLEDCVLMSWQAGRTTPAGGYEAKYGDKWYESRPNDKTPKCSCGLSDLQSKLKEDK